MRSMRRMLGILAAGFLAASCGGSPSAPPAPQATKTALAEQPEATKVAPKPAATTVTPKLPEAGPPLPPTTYESKGRRDPFRPVTVAKEKPGLEVSTVKLVGIINGRKLLALVEAQNGLGYIVKPGDVLGNGHVTDVTTDSVTFAVSENSSPRETSLTLRLARD
jgi:Tfp pilus assembly protein PilP